MAHKSLELLASELERAASQVLIGGNYAHYKHTDQPYVVKGFAILEATDEIAVRYTPLNNPNVEFVRPLSSWLETINWDGKTVPRFMAVG